MLCADYMFLLAGYSGVNEIFISWAFCDKDDLVFEPAGSPGKRRTSKLDMSLRLGVHDGFDSLIVEKAVML